MASDQRQNRQGRKRKTEKSGRIEEARAELERRFPKLAYLIEVLAQGGINADDADALFQAALGDLPAKRSQAAEFDAPAGSLPTRRLEAAERHLALAKREFGLLQARALINNEIALLPEAQARARYDLFNAVLQEEKVPQYLRDLYRRWEEVGMTAVHARELRKADLEDIVKRLSERP